MFRKTSLSVVILMSVFLAACAGTKKNTSDSETIKNQTSTTVDNNKWGTGFSEEYLARLGITKNPLEYTTVYFEYDSSQIDERSQIIIAAHTRYLAARSGMNVVLEGRRLL